MRRSLAGLTLLALAGTGAWADEASRLEEAREHYQAGNRHLNFAEYDAAVEEFKKAYNLSEKPGFLFNIAQAYRLGGNCAMALRFYKNYLRLEAEDMANLIDSADTDVSAEAPNTWYFAWVIADSTGANATRAFVSAASEVPTLPPGYDKARLLGAARNDPASDILPFAQAWPSLWVSQKEVGVYAATPASASTNVAVAANTACPGTQLTRLRLHNIQSVQANVTFHHPDIAGLDAVYSVGLFPDNLGRLVVTAPVGGPLRDEELRWSRSSGATLSIAVQGYEWREPLIPERTRPLAYS